MLRKILCATAMVVIVVNLLVLSTSDSMADDPQTGSWFFQQVSGNHIIWHCERPVISEPCGPITATIWEPF